MDTESCWVPEELGGVTQDQHQRIGEEQLIELFAAVEVTQQQPFDDGAKECDAECREQRRGPEPLGGWLQPLYRLPGEIGAEHVERAVREIEDAHDAENKREARGDQEQEHCGGQAAHELTEQERRRHRRPSPSRPSRRARARACRHGASFARARGVAHLRFARDPSAQGEGIQRRTPSPRLRGEGRGEGHSRQFVSVVAGNNSGFCITAKG